jgi:hypothetical protein
MNIVSLDDDLILSIPMDEDLIGSIDDDGDRGSIQEWYRVLLPMTTQFFACVHASMGLLMPSEAFNRLQALSMAIDNEKKQQESAEEDEEDLPDLEMIVEELEEGPEVPLTNKLAELQEVILKQFPSVPSAFSKPTVRGISNAVLPDGQLLSEAIVPVRTGDICTTFRRPKGHGNRCVCSLCMALSEVAACSSEGSSKKRKRSGDFLRSLRA